MLQVSIPGFPFTLIIFFENSLMIGLFFRGAAELAHASCLAALVYMMVIPYQIVVAVQKSGENYIPLAIHACKKRIKELIVVSRDREFYCKNFFYTS